ncbi:MAG: DUF4170 domain-containing protein [Alphaproteobacteria bacterium]|nr:DUF4170 domain-containing protein [Alphaproteobacteria bacterium]
MRYWVIGGEYTDTDFRQIAPGKAEERVGPFASFKEARDAWAGRAFATIDHCLVRYRIVEDTA